MRVRESPGSRVWYHARFTPLGPLANTTSLYIYHVTALVSDALAAAITLISTCFGKLAVCVMYAQ